MKILLLILSFLVVSCGKYKVAGVSDTTVGETRALTTGTLSGTEVTDIQSICAALGIKRAILPSAVNSTHTFMATQKDCTGNTINNGTVEVLLTQSGQSFIFKKKSDGQDFIFPNVETPTEGLMSDICANQGTNSNIIVSTPSVTSFTTQGINPENCLASGSEERCIQVETGTINADNSWTVKTKEWMKVRVSSPTNSKIGFFTLRKKITQSFCGNNEALLFQATLQ